MTKIAVRDFGPIAEGSVELKPLTVFIGPNNSGKSYMSLLVYALSLVTGGATGALPGEEAWGYGADYPQDHWDAAREALSSWQVRPKYPSTLPVEYLPEEVQKFLSVILERDALLLTLPLEDELRRCFGSQISEVGRRGADEFSLSVQDDTQGLLWRMKSDSEKDALALLDWKSDFPDEVDLRKSPFERYRPTFHTSTLHRIVERLPYEVFPKLTGNAHYLPASRTGILAGHKTMASVIVGQASLAWVKPIEVPRLTGAVTDLIQTLLLLKPVVQPADAIWQMAVFLEKKITNGKVDVDMQAEYPEIYFEDDTGRYRLHQVSSTVSEMAPLVLYLKYVARPGERVIIEEPESHLDAGNQRNLASAIAMMVNAGVNVLVTTHSDFFVSELNNLMLASGVDAEYTEDYDASELLRPEQVGACFFHPGDDGTRVEEIKMTREEGIDVDSFSKVFRDIYDEAIRLEHAGT